MRLLVALFIGIGGMVLSVEVITNPWLLFHAGFTAGLVVCYIITTRQANE